MSLRASDTGSVILTDCRVSVDAALEHKPGLGAAFRCLNEARFGVSWGVIGAAKACFECVRSYAGERIQFGRPIAAKQLIQAAIVDAASAIINAEALSLHFGRSKQLTGHLLPEQVSLLKRNNVQMALGVARSCRSMLGANGILLDYPVIRHLLNLESVFTYEGTHEVHTLIVGKGLTGIGAF
jgi:glutaryl-CoA dehydrogenase